MTMEEYALKAKAEIGRWYGRLQRWGEPTKNWIPCEQFMLEHWKRFPWTAPKDKP